MSVLIWVQTVCEDESGMIFLCKSCVKVFNLFHAGEFFMLLLSSADLFRVSNGLDPDQDRCYVGPNLGPNCLQKTISR